MIENQGFLPHFLDRGLRGNHFCELDLSLLTNGWSLEIMSSELKTLEWDILNPNRLINLEIKKKSGLSIIIPISTIQKFPAQFLLWKDKWSYFDFRMKVDQLICSDWVWRTEQATVSFIIKETQIDKEVFEVVLRSFILWYFVLFIDFNFIRYFVFIWV